MYGAKHNPALLHNNFDGKEDLLSPRAFSNLKNHLEKALKQAKLEKAENDQHSDALNQLSCEDLRACDYALMDLTVAEKPHYKCGFIALKLSSDRPLNFSKFSNGQTVILNHKFGVLKTKNIELQVTISDKTETSVTVDLPTISQSEEIFTCKVKKAFFITVAGKDNLDKIVINQLKSALQALSSNHGFISNRLWNSLFNSSMEQVDGEGQEKAIEFSAKKFPLTLIQGPPGCGKTSTLGKIVNQCVIRGERVLLCAPSNAAADAATLAIARNWSVGKRRDYQVVT